MDTRFIETVPIFYFNQSVRELLQYLLDTGTDAKHILICDKKRTPYGVIHSDKLYRDIAFGLHFEHLLESICDINFKSIPQNSSYINPELLASGIIVVTDETGACMGIARNSALLLDFIQQDRSAENIVSQSLLSNLPVGVLVAEPSGVIQFLNPMAKNILRSLGMHSIQRIEDFLPKYDYAIPTRKYHINVKEINLEVSSHLCLWEDGQLKIALILTDVSEKITVKKALAKATADCRKLQNIINHCYDEIYVTDEQGVCILVNSACERIYGLKQGDMLGKSAEQMKANGFISSNLSEKVIKTKRRLLEMQTTKIGQKILVIGTPILDKSGKVHNVVINSREMADMIDMRIYVDNLNQENCSNITDRIMSLTLHSKQIVAESTVMQKVVKQATQVSQTDTPVLLLGETGTGKDVIATLIHEISNRRDKKMHRLNCASFSPEQLELELFGCLESSSENGQAFKRGMCFLADKSTIFLDEIDELPYSLQGKLLHVIEDKTYIPLRSTVSFSSDFRVIAASSANLPQLVQNGQFRKDLYYRLNVMSITIPPLRERQEDIPILAQHIISSINKTTGKQKELSLRVVDRLKCHYWDGNVRELKNVLERLWVLTDDKLITEEALQDIPEFTSDRFHCAEELKYMLGHQDLPSILEEIEKHLIEDAVSHCGSTYSLAEYLGISQATAVRKMQKYKLRFHKPSTLYFDS